MSAVPDYYWRDYLGNTPPDAIPGGHDLTNKTTFIGQGYCHKVGLLPGVIYPGITGMKVPYGGYSYSSETGVKILCSSNLNCFSWQQAAASTLHSTTIGKHLVFGGYENDNIIHIGRAMYQGELIVGKVLGYEAENAKLCFVYRDREVSVSSYEVLIYDPRPVVPYEKRNHSIRV